MIRKSLGKIVPHWQNAALALLSAGLLTLAFPDFELWFLAWFALVPLMWSVQREGAFLRAFILGWLFGTAFFFGTCWWLTYAPIHYAGFPWPLAYLLILIACLGAGVFPGVFAALLSLLLRRFGSWAFLAAPFLWVFSEFARYWLTGNNWNALGYSQAFNPAIMLLPGLGGEHLVSFVLALANSSWMFCWHRVGMRARTPIRTLTSVAPGIAIFTVVAGLSFDYWLPRAPQQLLRYDQPFLVAIQPNVPMHGLSLSELEQLRTTQLSAAEAVLTQYDKGLSSSGDREASERPAGVVVLPESPMNFMYGDDREFQQVVRAFTSRKDVSLIFNSAEVDAATGKYFNSAVMVGPEGRKVAEYDKVYLLPFGEVVPVPFDSIVPAFVGSFAYGRNFPLLPIGDSRAGVMICFESHFGALGRDYVKGGADILIEMTNDGYLGPTPVLRQHLANAVFRAAETDRPVLRVTNVGITAYITPRGQVLESAPSYTEATRVWSVPKSDGSQTFYVRFGDWLAWLCTGATFILLVGVVAATRYRRGSID